MIRKIEQEVTTAEVDNIYQELTEEFDTLAARTDLPRALIQQVEAERERVVTLYQRAIARTKQADEGNEAINEFNRVQALLAEAVGRTQERGLKQHVIEGAFVVNHDNDNDIDNDIDNITGELNRLFQEYQELYQCFLDIPGLPQGLIQEVTREFEATSESVERCRRKLAAKKARSRENDDELNNSTH